LPSPSPSSYSSARNAAVPRVHLIAAGSSIAHRLEKIGLGDPRWLCDRVAHVLGGRYRVTADLRCLTAPEDDDRAGRTDDARRASDLQRALGDDSVTAIVSLAGGAWFVRTLHQIDFDVLRRRRTRVRVFGFSEMTALVNLVSTYSSAEGVHDVTPLFVLDRARPKRTAVRQLDAFIADLGRMLAGQASSRRLTGDLLTGKVPRRSVIHVVGGNLTLVAAMMGGPYAKAFSTRGSWLALEDVNEKPEQIDRKLAQLRLAGLFDSAEGLFLGDFRRDGKDMHAPVVECLRFCLPSRRIPVVVRCNFGHVWPAAPLPLRRPLSMARKGDRVQIEWA
jgi:muramoyltetrapeptide carboxypeptidase LdcA involved in peptidoglycan recycling